MWESSVLSKRIISWILNVDIILKDGLFEFKKNFLNKDIIITNLKSFFAPQVAQTVMAGIFSFYRGLDSFTSVSYTHLRAHET